MVRPKPISHSERRGRCGLPANTSNDSDARGYRRAPAWPATNLIASRKTCGKPNDGDFNVPGCSLHRATHHLPESLLPFASVFWESEGRAGATAFEKLRTFLVNGCQLQMRRCRMSHNRAHLMFARFRAVQCLWQPSS